MVDAVPGLTACLLMDTSVKMHPRISDRRAQLTLDCRPAGEHARVHS